MKLALAVLFVMMYAYAGNAQAPVCDKSLAKKLTINMKPAQQNRWIAYWKAQK